MKKERNAVILAHYYQDPGCACNKCPQMRLNTIEKVLTALENVHPEITPLEDLRLKAPNSLEKMLALS